MTPLSMLMAITTRATCEQKQNSEGLMSNWVPGKQTIQTTTLYCIYFLWYHCIAYIRIIIWTFWFFLNIWNLHMFFSSLLQFLWQLPTSQKPLESSKRQQGFPSCAMCISHRCQSRIHTSVSFGRWWDSWWYPKQPLIMGTISIGSIWIHMRVS